MAIVINGSGTVTGISVGGLPDNIVDAGTLANDAVGLAQMASGTDGNVITYDTSGNPAVVATGSSGQVLTSAGADAVPTMAASAVGGKVLQVVATAFEGSITTTSTTHAATGLSATITPSSSSSKILVTVTGGGQTGTSNDVGNLNSIFRSINSATAATIAESGTDMQINYAYRPIVLNRHSPT